MRVIPLLLSGVLLSGLFARLHAAEPDTASFASLTGAEVIERLQKPETCQLALYELCRRGGAATEGFGLFKLMHPEPEVRLSLQTNGEPPLYVVTFGISKERHLSVKDFQEFEANPDKSKSRDYSPAFWVFTEGGAQVEAFRGNDLRGVLADINGDGTLELVETLRGMEITPIRLDPKPLLSLRPAGDGKWKFRLNDENQDGIWEVEGGLREHSIFTTRATWNWDAVAKRYSGPESGDGFTRYNDRDTSSQIQQGSQTPSRRRRVIHAPVPPDGIPSVGQSLVYRMPDKSKGSETPVKSAPKLERPKGTYRHPSMRGASDDKIFRFMGYVKQADSQPQTENKEKGNYLPKRFWQDDARAMALAYLEGNCSRSIRAENQITLEDSKGAAPPLVCSVSFSNFSSRCYVAEDTHYFLKVDPLGSYLAFARTRSRGKELFNSVHDQPEFDLRQCELSYADARKVSDVIWWLDRVRMRPYSFKSAWSATMSTADGDGRLVLRSPDGTLIRLDATLWHDVLEERWRNNFGKEVFLNFAANLMEKELPARLQARWGEQEPKMVLDSLLGAGVEISNKRLENLASRFLQLFSFDERDISFAVASQAARYAGYISSASSASHLEEITSKIPPGSPRRPREVVVAELNTMGRSQEERAKREQLEKERDEIVTAEASDSPEYLRCAAADALKQIEIGAKSDSLYSLAISEQPLAGWALRRLSAVDQERYADALEWWVFHQINPQRGAQYFQELARAKPDRAAEATEKVLGSGPLAVKAFALLQDRKIDVRHRIPALLQTIGSSTFEIGERILAIELLLSYDDAEIDDTLLHLISTSNSETEAPVVEAAARALAIRGGLEPAFQAIQQFLEVREYYAKNARMLDSLALIAQRKPELKPQLSDIIQRQLQNPKADQDALLWAAWSADLRNLDPEVQSLAAEGKVPSAKRISALWQEPDALTQIRMLTALGLLSPYEFFGNDAPGKSQQMKIALAETSAHLSDKAELEEFLDRMAKEKKLPVLRPEVRERVSGAIRGITR